MRYLSIGALGALFAFVLSSCQRERAVPGVPPGRTWSYSAQVSTSPIQRTDLLLVVSNAPTMAAKQKLLVEAIPQMVRRLVWPSCVDATGAAVENPGTCPEGTVPATEPLRDLNVGVITTSLGGHGSNACPRGEEGMDDRAHFIPKVRSDVPDPDGTGFLSWRGGTLSDLEGFIENLQAHVEAVGVTGCEAPAPLEAWYRALVDPSPALEIVVGEEGLSGARRSADGEVLIDPIVVAQREEFLRPESLVSIVMVSDQDDCSVMEGGVLYENAGLGHRILDTTTPMAPGTSACEEDPHGECCLPCSSADEAPAHCETAACEGAVLPAEMDRATVRCFDMKRRFGVDLAYPIDRYVDGLSRPMILESHTGDEVENPLLRGAGRHAGRPRDPGLVFLAGVVGVPWQDVATENSLHSPGTLELLTADELQIQSVAVEGGNVSRWEVLLEPLDPFLVPSIDPRQAGRANPISASVIVGPSSNDPFANDINGHEADHSVVIPDRYPDGGPARDRLQASCRFPLEELIDCDAADDGCLCSDEPARNSAACTPPEGGSATTTQYFAEAYPAPRMLRALHAFGHNSIIAPICPKITAGVSPTDPSYGFNPTFDALTQRLPDDIRPRCFPRELPVDEEGQSSCIVVEAWPTDGRFENDSTCEFGGRSEVSDFTRDYIMGEIEESGRCGTASEISCDDYRMCSIDQLVGAEAHACLFDADAEGSSEPGFCYIDPELTDESGRFIAGGGIEGGNPIVQNCPAGERRMLRFVGEDTPRPGTVTFIACQMTSLSSTSERSVEEWLAPFTEGDHDSSDIPPAPEEH